MDSVIAQLALSLVGLAVLARSADAFVDGAIGLSRRYGVSPVLVGAVVIGLGTSLPELLISVIAAAEGDPQLGVGNVIGSNVANLSLVLGAAALLTPIAVSSSILRHEAPVSFAAVLTFAIALQGGLTRVEGTLMITALVVVIALAIRRSTRVTNEALAVEVEAAASRVPSQRIGLITLAGLVGTAIGAQLLVTGATGLAGELGLSDGLVGVTLVAIGTSLPELATAVQAARRGEDELIIGNVLGSNVVNSLLVGGMLGLIAPGPLDDVRLVTVGAATMVVVAGLAWALMARGRHIVRGEAAVLLLGYVAVVVAIA